MSDTPAPKVAPEDIQIINLTAGRKTGVVDICVPGPHATIIRTVNAAEAERLFDRLVDLLLQLEIIS